MRAVLGKQACDFHWGHQGQASLMPVPSGYSCNFTKLSTSKLLSLHRWKRLPGLVSLDHSSQLGSPPMAVPSALKTVLE